ncbi:helix-turn-helix domain-containing protein [Streptomyces sp. NBC_00019]|uniref:helix-turn-helix domain-containing protein n=1 Tax=Streptomyces sp. NBC_00019 TaxID=2975623 RepID=UPI002F90823F
MFKPGRPKAVLHLMDSEHRKLVRLAEDARTPRDIALRCNIVLTCAQGVTNREVARRIGVREETVGKWRARFVQEGVAGLCVPSRRNHGGRPKPVLSLSEDERLRLEEIKKVGPPSAALLSTVLLASASGLTNREIARANGLAEHTVGRWRARFLANRLLCFGADGLPGRPRARLGVLAE